MNKLDLYEDADKDLVAHLMEPGLHEDDWCSWSPLWCIEEFLKDGLVWKRYDVGSNPDDYAVELTWAGLRVAAQYAYELEFNHPALPMFDRPIKEVVRLYEARLERIS